MLISIFISIMFGSLIGSFLNVVIYRVPRGESIVYGRSHCPKCNTKIKIYDLIPVLSWFFLKGKCRYCKDLISFSYPAIEAITSISFVVSYLFTYYGVYSSLVLNQIIFGWILASCLISLSVIDLKHMIIPKLISNFSIIMGFIWILSRNLLMNKIWSNSFDEHFYACLIGLLGTFLLNLLVVMIYKKQGIGMGDGKLFAISGAWMGFSGLEVTATLSFICAGLFSLAGLMTSNIKRGDYIPFGPFICLSIFLVWLFGSSFWIDSLSDLFWWR